MKTLSLISSLVIILALTGFKSEARGQSSCVASVTPIPALIGQYNTYKATGLRAGEYVTPDFGLGRSPFSFWRMVKVI